MDTVKRRAGFKANDGAEGAAYDDPLAKLDERGDAEPLDDEGELRARGRNTTGELCFSTAFPLSAPAGQVSFPDGPEMREDGGWIRGPRFAQEALVTPTEGLPTEGLEPLDSEAPQEEWDATVRGNKPSEVC